MSANQSRNSAIGILLGLAGAAVQAGDLAPDLRAAMRHGGELPVIVRFAGRVDLDAFPGRGRGRGVQRAAMLQAMRALAADSQGPALKLLRQRGAARSVQLWSINALAATADPGTIDAIAALPGVESVGLDATLAAPGPAPLATGLPEWNLEAVGVPLLWDQGLRGAGTVVALMDTGADALHPDLASRWRAGANSWFDPNGEHATPYDASGHGTQVLGVLVGGDAGGSAVGVAPEAQWIAVKIFNDAGIATLSGIHLGFQWLLDPDGDPATDDQPDVVNNSWGFPELAGSCYTEFEADIEALKAAGIAVVFAGGNQGAGGSLSPADNPAGFAVGAVDAALTVAATSSRGPSACDGSLYPEVVAPGVGVRTTDLTFNGVFPESYATLSGSSLAAPHVAGGMALLRQSDPAVSVEQLEQAVTGGALDIDVAGPDHAAGYGLLDAPGALDWLAAVPSGPSCTDLDGDGFYAETDCGTAPDCDDLDGGINPAACDIKGDGIDQDCDGTDRLKGRSCPGSGDGGGDSGGGGSGGGKGKKK